MSQILLRVLGSRDALAWPQGQLVRTQNSTVNLKETGQGQRGQCSEWVVLALLGCGSKDWPFLRRFGSPEGQQAKKGGRGITIAQSFQLTNVC